MDIKEPSKFRNHPLKGNILVWVKITTSGGLHHHEVIWAAKKKHQLPVSKSDVLSTPP